MTSHSGNSSARRADAVLRSTSRQRGSASGFVRSAPRSLRREENDLPWPNEHRIPVSLVLHGSQVSTAQSLHPAPPGLCFYFASPSARGTRGTRSQTDSPRECSVPDIHLCLFRDRNPADRKSERSDPACRFGGLS